MLAVEHGLLYGVEESVGIAAASGAEGSTIALLNDAMGAHRALRDRLADLLDRWSVTPPAAADAYTLPPVDRTTVGACQLAAAMEDRSGASWLDAVGRTSDRALRATATDALAGSAVRAAKLHALVGTPLAQAAPSFPGR